MPAERPDGAHRSPVGAGRFGVTFIFQSMTGNKAFLNFYHACRHRPQISSDVCSAEFGGGEVTLELVHDLPCGELVESARTVQQIRFRFS